MTVKTKSFRFYQSLWFWPFWAPYGLGNVLGICRVRTKWINFIQLLFWSLHYGNWRIWGFIVLLQVISFTSLYDSAEFIQLLSQFGLRLLCAPFGLCRSILSLGFPLYPSNVTHLACTCVSNFQWCGVEKWTYLEFCLTYIEIRTQFFLNRCAYSPISRFCWHEHTASTNASRVGWRKQRNTTKTTISAGAMFDPSYLNRLVGFHLTSLHKRVKF